MNRSMRTSVAAGTVAALAIALAAPAAAQWKPDKPITIIVPWAAGGSTDQVTRVTAAEIEKSLGQKVVILNQPGASGSIGTKNALEAAKDGYTWAAGAAQDLGAYRTLGMLDTNITDWHLFLHVANVPVVGVNAGTSYKDLKDLPDAMKAKPGEITVATAGVTSGRPQCHGGDLQGDRRQVPPRHLRRRQPCRGRHGGRRDAGHHATRGRAGRDESAHGRAL